MENKDKYSMKNIIDLYNNGQIRNDCSCRGTY